MFALLVTTFVSLVFAYYFKKWMSLPPGPFPFPLIGNMPQLGWLIKKHGGLVEAMKELRRKYGPVYTLWLGPIPSVHICSMELAQETMVKRGNDFADRWVPYLWSIVNNNLGIFNASGPHWQEQRRFTIHTLRNFGLGKSIMEENIMNELELRVKDLDAMMTNDNIVFDPREYIELMVGSISNRILTGERWEKESETRFFELKHRMDEYTADFGMMDFFAEYQIMWKIPFLKNRWNKMLQTQWDLCDFLRAQIRERIESIEKGERVIVDKPEDYIDAFLQKMEENKREKDTPYTEDSLVYNLMDLWSAGQETLTITLRQGFLQLIQSPDVLVKAREELQKVTKGERSLSLKDKMSTPYFNAVAIEIQRISSIVEVNMFRKVNGDTRVGEFIVPDGTPITAEVSVLMTDDDLFIQPRKFNPSRFIDNPDLEKHVLPFSLGKRSCPGESLAKAEIYLLIGNLILRYDFETVSKEIIPDCMSNDMFFKVPPGYEMKVTKL